MPSGVKPVPHTFVLAACACMDDTNEMNDANDMNDMGDTGDTNDMDDMGDMDDKNDMNDMDDTDDTDDMDDTDDTENKDGNGRGEPPTSDGMELMRAMSPLRPSVPPKSWSVAATVRLLDQDRGCHEADDRSRRNLGLLPYSR